MLIPLENKSNRVICVLEVTNVPNHIFGFDQEYFGLVVANYCYSKIANSIQLNILKEEIK